MAMACPPEIALAITRKKARYARYADLKDMASFAAEVALPDATYDFQDPAGRTLDIGGVAANFASTAAFVAWWSGFAGRLQTLHNLGAAGDFTVTETTDGDGGRTTPVEVESVFGFEDQLLAPPFGMWAAIRGGGYYYDTWRCVDGDWKLKSLRMRRTYQEMTFLVWLSLLLQRALGINLL
ncbi:hypothetical protein GGR56DRAFT_614398 [Xylariaceae sp. FL0804]|nr:hypothetical protein GGR56DRAFT_614398 [Xylariaceae sp. FL0804]